MVLVAAVQKPFEKPIPVSRGVGKEMTVEEFKGWLKQFDTNNDGISRAELRKAIRSRGVWFSTLQSLRAVGKADRDGNGFIDDSEIENLVSFAQKHLGMKISTS